MTRPNIRVTWGKDADQSLGFPSYETTGAAGADLRANFDIDTRDTGITLDAGARVLIPTGLHFEIPIGFEVQIRPRSGLALKHGITLPNTPGTIDSDYRGPIGVILLNTGDQAIQIAHGDRIAQMVIASVIQADFVLADQLTETDRDQGGFGSTGRN